jgi:hypothetical protein
MSKKKLVSKRIKANLTAYIHSVTVQPSKIDSLTAKIFDCPKVLIHVISGIDSTIPEWGYEPVTLANCNRLTNALNL